MKLIKVLIITFSIFMHSFNANAGENGSHEDFADGSYSNDIALALKNTNEGINNFTQHFYQETSDVGQKLFLYLGLIALAFHGMKVAMSSGSGSLSEPMAGLIRLIILAGITGWLLTPTGYNLMIVNGIDGLSNQLSELAIPGSNLQNGFISFTTAEFNVIGDIISKGAEQGLWDFLTKAGLLMLLTIILIGLFIIFSLLSIVAFLSVLVSVAIGMSIGPLFIPFLLLEKTTFLFDGWIRFMLTACFTKVVVAIIIAIGLFAFKALGTGPGSMLGAITVTTALGGMLVFQLLRAPEIAQSIMSGSAISFAKCGSKAGNLSVKGVTKLLK